MSGQPRVIRSGPRIYSSTGLHRPVSAITGHPVDPITGQPVDPITGQPIDPVTGNLIGMNTIIHRSPLRRMNEPVITHSRSPVGRTFVTRTTAGPNLTEITNSPPVAPGLSPVSHHTVTHNSPYGEMMVNRVTNTGHGATSEYRTYHN